MNWHNSFDMKIKVKSITTTGPMVETRELSYKYNSET